MTHLPPVACRARAAGRVAAPTARREAWLARLAAVVIALVVAFPVFAWEPGSGGLVPVPALVARVNDHTRTLAAAEAQALESRLADWETRTGNQLVVLLVPTTQPEPIEAYAIRVADAWKIGRRGQDNGVLLLVAKDDRKIRIEVGYGLEGVLTDVAARRIIAETIAPAFRDGRFGAGISAGADAIMRAAGGGGSGAAPRPKGSAAKSGGVPFDIESLLVVVLVVVPLVGALLRRIFGRFLGSLVGAGVMGTAAFVVVGSLVIAVIAGIVAFVVMLVMGFGSGFTGRRGGGVYLPGGGWGGGGGWSSGGGGFSGGGGSFGGGGASGGWD